eukprot:gnl/Spiro4/13731_TR7323_c0_g1_i1.p1 gnl/Spiro4/13731_TR7323_c0_g1~~gnl/Spiro4/13731_TR7323_c0_g1_i1.p1  ORF type:complete len:1123 (+),score=279.62 gnl/Spiro4/13731_TR7323_c0_g1_i1:87-3455(+)
MSLSNNTASTAQLSAAASRIWVLEQSVATQWILVCALLTLVMKCGFFLQEAGSSRARNVVNVTFKNLLGFTNAGILWGVGYAFALSGGNGGIGDTYFFFSNNFSQYEMWFALCSYVLVCTSIACGGLADRLRLGAQATLHAVTTAWIFPVVIHWVWSNQGWLSAYRSPPLLVNGLIDFGGATIHMVGGCIALVTAFVAGARSGRFDEDGTAHDIPGHSTILTTLGTFLLWFGWYGLNQAGTILQRVHNGDAAFNALAPRVLANTTICAAACSLTAVLLGRALTGVVDSSICMKGLVAGLAASSAGCGVVQAWGAFLTGVLGGVVFMFGVRLLLWARIDDQLLSGPVHFFSAAWGMIAVGFFADQAPIATAYTNIASVTDWGCVLGGGGRQLGMQVLGVVVIVAWTVSCCVALFLFLKLLSFVCSANTISGADSVDEAEAESRRFGEVTGYGTDFIKIMAEQQVTTTDENVRVLDVATVGALSTLERIRGLVSACDEDLGMVQRLDDIMKVISSGTLYDCNIEEIAADEEDQDVRQYLLQNYMQPPAGAVLATESQAHIPLPPSTSISTTVSPATTTTRARGQSVLVDAPPVDNVDLATQWKNEENAHRLRVHKTRTPDELDRRNQLRQYLKMVPDGGALGTWDYDVFHVAALSNGKPLYWTAKSIFRHLNFFERFLISRRKFKLFFTTLESGYRADNPFHNHLHAADVMHNIFYLMTAPNIQGHFSELETLAALLGAACHDFKHPGVNNNFLIATYDDLAVVYSDQSVLENFHLAETFRLLLQPDMNLLASLETDQYKTVRKIMIDLVLSTDMQGHKDFLDDFASRIAPSFDWADSEHRYKVLQLALKVSDIANPAKPQPINLLWCDGILAEFYSQGDMELARGLPQSPMMSRNGPPKEKSQIAFIDFVLSPLFDLWARFSGEYESIGIMQQNRNYWQSKVDQAAPQPPLDPNTPPMPSATRTEPASSTSSSIRPRLGVGSGTMNQLSARRQRMVVSGSEVTLPSPIPSFRSQYGSGVAPSDRRLSVFAAPRSNLPSPMPTNRPVMSGRSIIPSPQVTSRTAGSYGSQSPRGSMGPPSASMPAPRSRQFSSALPIPTGKSGEFTREMSNRGRVMSIEPVEPQ